MAPDSPSCSNEDQRVLERVRGRQRGAGHLKLLGDVQDDKGLILDDEDRAPF